ncbi:MAG: hypothetical protein ABIH76_07645, partial [Candidatus Bathyarchaeota archaeon]
MNRVEVIAPSKGVDELIRGVGKLGTAEFISLTTEKEDKYKTITEEVRHTDREDSLLQLSNRISSTLKKLGEVPYPETVSVKDDPEEVLRNVEVEAEKLEVEVAKVENLMKEVVEERASFEKDTTQFYEEYEGIRKLLTEYGVNLSYIQSLEKDSLVGREKIREVYNNLLELQRTLAFIDASGKLNIPHVKVSQNEIELRQIYENIQETSAIHEKVKEDLRGAGEEIAKLDDMIREINEAVRRKIEAVEKLESVKTEAVTLKGEIEELERNLNEKTTRLLGGTFSSSLKNVTSSINKLRTLLFGSPEIEATMHRISKNAYDVLRGSEILEYADKFLTLSSVRKLIDGMRREKPEELKSLLEGSEKLLSRFASEHLKILDRALRVLYLEYRIKELVAEPPK